MKYHGTLQHHCTTTAFIPLLSSCCSVSKLVGHNERSSKYVFRGLVTNLVEEMCALCNPTAAQLSEIWVFFLSVKAPMSTMQGRTMAKRHHFTRRPDTAFQNWLLSTWPTELQWTPSTPFRRPRWWTPPSGPLTPESKRIVRTTTWFAASY